MIFGTNGKKIYENFSVTNESNELVSGIDSTSFIVQLFEPNNQDVSDQINVDIVELGNGHYQAEFIANKPGIWYMILYHNQYFPWGKSDDIQVYSSDFDDISDDLGKVLGLVHQNIFIDKPIYDDENLISARLRIYSDSGSVGTDQNVISTYQITSFGDGPGRFINWKQVEI